MRERLVRDLGTPWGHYTVTTGPWGAISRGLVPTNYYNLYRALLPNSSLRMGQPPGPCPPPPPPYPVASASLRLTSASMLTRVSLASVAALVRMGVTILWDRGLRNWETQIWDPLCRVHCLDQELIGSSLWPILWTLNVGQRLCHIKTSFIIHPLKHNIKYLLFFYFSVKPKNSFFFFFAHYNQQHLSKVKYKLYLNVIVNCFNKVR